MTIDKNMARNYDRGMWALERFSLSHLRRKILAEAKGNILEVGAGTGVNLPLYHPGVTVTAVDLRPAHLIAAIDKARRNGRDGEISVTCANAQELPFPKDSFDTVVGTLVFCSIAHPELALAEIRRVLRPDGRLLLLEHVRGQEAISRRLTDWLHPLWFSLQGVCHLNRETAATVENSGFLLDHTSSYAWGVLQMIKATPIVSQAASPE